MFEYLAANKEWIFSGIGVAIVTLIASKARSIELGGNIFDTGSRQRIRRYLSHYVSYQEVMNGFFLKSRMKISRSWPAHLKAEFRSRQWNYKGRILIEQTVMTISLKGVGHRAASVFIFKDPPFDFDMLSGVYAGFSRNRLPMSGRIVMQKVSETTYNSSESLAMRRTELPAEIREIFDTDRQDAIVVPELEMYAAEEGD